MSHLLRVVIARNLNVLRPTPISKYLDTSSLLGQADICDIEIVRYDEQGSVPLAETIYFED